MEYAPSSGTQPTNRTRPSTYRPLRPLLPKARLETVPEHSHETGVRQKGCGLSACPNPNCQLRSHQLYGLTMTQRKTKRGPMTRIVPIHAINWNDLTASWVDRRLYDGLPSLPDETHDLIQSKELFHYFFTQQMDRVRQIYIPFVEADEYRKTSLSLALTNALHCVCILSNAKTDMIMRRNCKTPDRSSTAVYSMAASFLRKKLGDFEQPEIDLLIMLVIALTGLDFAFDRMQALEAHRKALERLVTLKGGLHVIDDYQSQVVQYVSKIDHLLATALGKPPLFNHEFGSHNFKLPDAPSGHYGKAWQEPKTLEVIDEDVANMCLDSCRLIHIAETEGITFYRDVTLPVESNAMPFFVCLRGRVGVDYGRLYTLYHENQTSDPLMTLSKSRCLVIACVLTDYLILWGDYYAMYRQRQASVLHRILKTQQSDEWDGHPDMLTWVLFVLSSAVPRTWEGHVEVVHLLRRLLRRKYDGRWPRRGWEKQELDNVRSYMWSDLAYNHSFGLTCKELVGINDHDHGGGGHHGDEDREAEGDEDEYEDEDRTEAGLGLGHGDEDGDEDQGIL